MLLLWLQVKKISALALILGFGFFSKVTVEAGTIICLDPFIWSDVTSSCIEPGNFHKPKEHPAKKPKNPERPIPYSPTGPFIEDQKTKPSPPPSPPKKGDKALE